MIFLFVIMLFLGHLNDVCASSSGLRSSYCQKEHCATEDGLAACMGLYDHKDRRGFEKNSGCIAMARQQKVDVDGLMDHYFPDHLNNPDGDDQFSAPGGEFDRDMTRDFWDRQKAAYKKIRTAAACTPYMCSDPDGLKKCTAELGQSGNTIDSVPECARKANKDNP